MACRSYLETSLLVFALGVFLHSERAVALNPSNALTQYSHMAWRERDQALPGSPYGIAQSRDGYLWIGTNNGPLSFDGERFRDLMAGEKSSNIRGTFLLKSARDGGVWVEGAHGVSKISGKRLIDYFSRPGSYVFSLAEDEDGIWFWDASRDADTKRFCRITNGDLRCEGAESGAPSTRTVTSMLMDDRKTLWLGASTALYSHSASGWTAMPIKGLEQNEGNNGVMALLDEGNGALLVGICRAGAGLGLQRLVNGRLSEVSATNFDGSSVWVLSLLKDHEGALWVGTTAGLYRIYGGVAEHFGASDGLSGSKVWQILEDREGAIWVTTEGGVDTFRNQAVVSFTHERGLNASEVSGLLVTQDGRLWVGGENTLYTLAPGESQFQNRIGDQAGKQIAAVFEDHTHRLWVGVDDKLCYLKDATFLCVPGIDGHPIGMIKSLAEDREGNLWGLTIGPPSHVFRLNLKSSALTLLPQYPPARRLISDAKGNIWLGQLDGHLGRISGDTMQVLDAQTAAPKDSIDQLYSGDDGSLFASTSRGLLIWKNNVLRLAGVKDGLPCEGIHAALQDSKGDIWLYAECGLVQLTADDYAKWWKSPAALLHPHTLQRNEGARPAWAPFTAVARTPDGRLWFANTYALQMADVPHLSTNTVIPPVHIEAIYIDGHHQPEVADLRVPPLTHDLQIDYTALSLMNPTDVHFRYKLDGYDRDWSEEITRRQAFYTNLPPAHYRFRVIASNNSGLWNMEGATIGFTVAPAFYQTVWFRALCAGALLGLVWLLVQLRARQLALRLTLRQRERDRIAQQLHDTFLQSVQGLNLQYAAAAGKLAEDHPVRTSLEDLLDRSGELVDEARESIYDLRNEVRDTIDLPRHLTSLGEELVAGTASRLSTRCTGEPRPLFLDAYEQVALVAREALQNAVRHANATAIELEMDFARAEFRLIVRDDGRGMDKETLSHGRKGHWGLSGMRQRASSVSGRLSISSEPGHGTEVRLMIPATACYDKRKP